MHAKRGFTLIEIMVVVGILAILMVALYATLSKQRSKAEDARVKNDLQMLKIAFENYYNDNNCYPPPEWFDSKDDCGAAYLSPYLNSMPCSSTQLPYVIEYAPTQCVGYRLYATLRNTDDTDIQQLADPNGSTLGNYGVSSGNTTVKIKLEGPGTYYCSQAAAGPNMSGNCTLIPTGRNCSPSFSSSSCDYTGSGNYCQAAGICN